MGRNDLSLLNATLFSEIGVLGGGGGGGGGLTATFRSVSALRYGILPFWRDRNCLVQSKSLFVELGEELRMILTLFTK